MGEFFMTYGTEILSAVGLIIGLIVAWLVKMAIEKNVTIKTIIDLAERVVTAVEQTSPDLHGTEKLTKAIDMMNELLAQYNIKLPTEQIVIFIEAAVGGFNKVFDKE